MWIYPEQFDVIVIGGGHAGCEAAHAAAKAGGATLLLTTNLDTVGKMSCNPAIGGTAKGQIVREIDALGGIMGKVTDRTAIQFRMLNRSKGPAVRAPRAQSDKSAYQTEMKRCLEEMTGLNIRQGTAVDLRVKGGCIRGVATQEGIFYTGRSVVLSSGTFMGALLHIGMCRGEGGRAGDGAVSGLSATLRRLGFVLGRLKTGTPPRVNGRTVDFSQGEEQPTEEGVRFSFEKQQRFLPKVSCHITYTNRKTHAIIEGNLHRSPLFSGTIKGSGPRYCPSVEDKVVRFPERERHQIFLEPEGLQTNEIYVNGLSSSLPFEVQEEMIRTVRGLEHAVITRPGYAVEYDYVLSGQVKATLETRPVEGLFLAGQVNGTTGYEEAAGQGLVAGINAVLKVRGEEPFLLQRGDAYIGVMIDDLVTKELDEPYRMFTSRAEHRLLLRQDNADLRLRPSGRKAGLVDDGQYARYLRKKERYEIGTRKVEKEIIRWEGKPVRASRLLRRPDIRYADLTKAFPALFVDYGEEINALIETDGKYAGYIEREEKEVVKLRTSDAIAIPRAFDYDKVSGLKKEAREKLKKHLPDTLGRATRIDGVSPADISLLMVSLKK
ncbi:MAG: tRNA uridine-5-carboxymethylaminomethyl(34) synthesis enzyme MnmG [Simkaniaceae bacterium]|nr:tRNA uridine-5-carboxymethylaminomethyl(34) synthesis enzyme MnmG [Simkaniaceae bacterium]